MCEDHNVRLKTYIKINIYTLIGKLSGFWLSQDRLMHPQHQVVLREVQDQAFQIPQQHIDFMYPPIYRTYLQLKKYSKSCLDYAQLALIVIFSIKGVFKAQNQAIISAIYKQNEIIQETTSNLKDFKMDPFFGSFLTIIQIYTSRRIQTQDVKNAIMKNTQLWNNFSMSILSPHLLQRSKYKCGDIPDVSDGPPVQYTVTKKQKQKNLRNSIKKEQKKSANYVQNEIVQTLKNVQNQNQNISPIKINLQTKQTKRQSEEVIQPISLDFSKKQSNQSQQKQEKAQSQSFQNFLKRKMGQNNKLVDQRRKSRTPTKLISGPSKRKKWGDTQDENSIGNLPLTPKKTISADQKFITKQQQQQKQPQQQIPKISLLKLARSKKPNKIRQRKINQTNDPYLIKWLQRSKRNIKNIR